MTYKCNIDGVKTTLTSKLVNGATVPAPAYCTSEQSGTVATTKSVANRLATHKAPKLYNQLQLGWDEVAQAAYDRLYLWDMATLPTAVIEHLPEYLGENGYIRNKNDNTIITFYFSSADWNIYDVNFTEAELIKSLKADWIVKDVDGNCVKLFYIGNSQYTPGIWTYLRNITNAELRNAIADTVYEKIISSDYVDGIYFDWASTSMSYLSNTTPAAAPGEIDLNGDGVGDTDEEIDALWTSSWKLLAQAVRNKVGGKLFQGNAGWENGYDYAPYLNGIMIEQFMLGPLSFPASYTWSSQMANYAYYVVNGKSPVTSMLQAGGTQTNYDFMRFTLASALMFNGYYSYTNSSEGGLPYTATWWYDEYAVNISNGVAEEKLSYKGWLGKPLNDAYNVEDENEKLYDTLMLLDDSADTKVWRRDYQHGIVICNPTDSTANVSLGGTYKKIDGVVDTSFNDGSSLTAISLASQRGAILRS